ncbi:MAG: hypothetical protein ACR2OV_17420, partial [Hyphomicrobiaceae bacterium]
MVLLTMVPTLGHKISNERDRSVLLAYQRCIDHGSHRFIVEETTSSDELEATLHLLLNDVWAPSSYRIRRVTRSGVFLRFETLRFNDLKLTVGEWIGNRRHGVVFVDAVKELREAAQ